MISTNDSAVSILRVVTLLGVALAVGPAFGVGFATSLLITALVALCAHERRVIGEWRAAPARLTTPH